MYCQTCAAEIQPGLNYCKRCGAQVFAALATRDAAAPVDLASPTRWLAATICLTLFIGFGMLLLTLHSLASLGIHGEPLVAITFFGFVAVFVTEFMLIRMMSRLLTTAKEEGRLPGPKRAGKKELRPASAQSFIQSPAYTDPLASVTEHTTRTFGPGHTEPRV